MEIEIPGFLFYGVGFFVWAAGVALLALAWTAFRGRYGLIDDLFRYPPLGSLGQDNRLILAGSAE